MLRETDGEGACVATALHCTVRRLDPFERTYIYIYMLYVHMNMYVSWSGRVGVSRRPTFGLSRLSEIIANQIHGLLRALASVVQGFERNCTVMLHDAGIHCVDPLDN